MKKQEGIGISYSITWMGIPESTLERTFTHPYSSNLLKDAAALAFVFIPGSNVALPDGDLTLGGGRGNKNTQCLYHCPPDLGWLLLTHLTPCTQGFRLMKTLTLLRVNIGTYKRTWAFLSGCSACFKKMEFQSQRGKSFEYFHLSASMIRVL